MSVNSQDASHEQQGSSLYAALARTTTRSMALYFSRPMRLFRPSKVSGWHSLRGLATQHGVSLTPQYISSLIKQQGFMVIPKHFIPPILVNVTLGTVLWTTYSEASIFLEPRFGENGIFMAALSGATAGGMQALVAAPVENVRLVLEGGSGKGWSHAWKEVFRGTAPPPSASYKDNLHEIRQVRNWMIEVRGMAGRGWDGWGWGCAKDVCGFAAFFSVFEVTRRVAASAKAVSQGIVQTLPADEGSVESIRRHFPRTIHGVTLVSGGVVAGLAYELICRPWDVARKAVQIDRATHSLCDHSAISSVLRLLRDDGILALFRDSTNVANRGVSSSNGSRRLYAALRTLARVGPWGVGFLVWEAFGPGLA